MPGPAPSFEDLYNLGRAEMVLRRPDLFVQVGDVTDFVVAAAAAMADKNVQRAAELFKATFVDGATGADLTTLADDHFNVQRLEANEATVVVRFNRPTAGAGAGIIPAGTVVATVQDALGVEIRFATDALVSWGALEIGDKDIGATAQAVGRASNVGPAKITRIVDSLFDPSITVANPLGAAGGSEEETDESLRQRIRDVPAALRRGTIAALEFGARTVAGVANAVAVEGPTGLVTVYITDVSGGSSVALEFAVATELENWRAAGALVNVQGGALFTQDVTVTLVVKAGTDVATLTPLIVGAIESRLEQLLIGETLYRSMIRTAAMNVALDKIVDVTVILPAADIVPTAAQLIRAGVVTVA